MTGTVKDNGESGPESRSGCAGCSSKIQAVIQLTHFHNFFLCTVVIYMCQNEIDGVTKTTFGAQAVSKRLRCLA